MPSIPVRKALAPPLCSFGMGLSHFRRLLPAGGRSSDAGRLAGLFWPGSSASRSFWADFTTCALPNLHAVPGVLLRCHSRLFMRSSHFSPDHGATRCQSPALRHGAETKVRPKELCSLHLLDTTVARFYGSILEMSTELTDELAFSSPDPS